MRLLLLGFAILGLSGCNPVTATADLASSEKAIESFHRDLNAGKFDDIYFSSADEMQRSAEILEFEKFLGAVQQKLGKAGKSTQQGWRVNYQNGTSFTVLNMQTSFEKGEATETFTYKSSPNGQLLVGYNIQSDAFILN